jgi:hypothetical protein
MPSLVDETWEWLDRAEQAREVAGQLTDPSARKAGLELAESFDRLARAALHPPCQGEGSWPGKTRKEPDDFSAKQQVSLVGRKRLIEHFPQGNRNDRSVRSVA